MTSSLVEPKPRMTNRLTLPRWAAFLLLFGLYLTFRGYHSYDGDQAYRLPLLLHWQDPTVFAEDPFVQALDRFNPHLGYLRLLDWTSRPFGLSTALLGLFVLTLGITSFGVDRLARSVWPDLGWPVGFAAVAMIVVAKAGNIGTNHLFESTLLDRLIGFALGWLALAASVSNPRRGAWLGAVFLALAALVHPSVGLQIALTLATGWLVWALAPGRFGVSRWQAIGAVAALGIGLSPLLISMSSQGKILFKGLPSQDFRILAVMIQGPQHMLPITWRTPQWLAWGCYPLLALLTIVQKGSDPWPAARSRLVALGVVNLISLGVAYLAVEVIGDLRVTVFQPFRMATLARGLALVVVSGRILKLWGQGDWVSQFRATLIGVGLTGDWTLVVATSVDLGMALVERTRSPIRWLSPLSGLGILVVGLIFLAKHDTEAGHWPILGGLAGLTAWMVLRRWEAFHWTRLRLGLAVGGAWAVPGLALVCAGGLPGSTTWSASLVERCRFAEVPTDDLERLGVWCRENTPKAARFIGPPGPKTFRLWSRRSLAFNRAASPYHAEGLADWFQRYRDHVGFNGTTAEFAQRYQDNRHSLEATYDHLDDQQLANLALRENATYILAAVKRDGNLVDGPLERLRVDGRYAVYRLRRQPGTGRKKSLGKIFQPPFSILIESLKQL